jgi:GT2 family glycosyltransferase
MKLSIIIVNWNTRDLLRECLSSIYKHPPSAAFEVLVVDNASADGSVQMLEEGFPQVRLIENHENIGFARANNQAIQQSIGHYVLLLNPDTQVKPNTLVDLVEFLDENPQAGAAGPRLLNPDGNLQTSCYPAPTLSKELWRLFHLDKLYTYGVYAMQAWDLDAPRSVDIVKGASLILRREALDQVGLLDEDYFIYTEEVDLCYRLKKSGWQLFWVPRSQVIHHEGQSTQLKSREMFLQLYKSKLIFFRKNHGSLAAGIYKAILFTASLTRLVVSPLAWLERGPKRQQHLKLAGNYFRMIMSLSGM